MRSTALRGCGVVAKVAPSPLGREARSQLLLHPPPPEQTNTTKNASPPTIRLDLFPPISPYNTKYRRHGINISSLSFTSLQHQPPKHLQVPRPKRRSAAPTWLWSLQHPNRPRWSAPTARARRAGKTDTAGTSVTAAGRASECDGANERRAEGRDK
jgi:hypothetical protein